MNRSSRKTQIGLALIVVCGGAAAWRTHASAGREQAKQSTQAGGDVRRVSGDRLKLKDGRDIEFAAIRLPFSSEPCAERARQTLDKWVNNEGVRLDFDETRQIKTDRLLAYVHANDTFINVRLVREGLAFVKLRQGNGKFARELLAAQSDAQRNRRGLWMSVPADSAGTIVGDPHRAVFHTAGCKRTNDSAHPWVTLQGTAAAYARGWAPCGECAPWSAVTASGNQGRFNRS